VGDEVRKVEGGKSGCDPLEDLTSFLQENRIESVATEINASIDFITKV